MTKKQLVSTGFGRDCLNGKIINFHMCSKQVINWHENSLQLVTALVWRYYCLHSCVHNSISLISANTLAWSVVCCDVVEVFTRVLCLFTVDGAVTKLQ